MKVSKLGLIQKKLSNIDDQFPVQDMLLQTGQIYQFGSGIYAYGHIPFLVKKKVSDIISEVLTKYGCTEISLPVLQPENLWIKSGRLEKYIEDGVMFRCETDKGNFCLAPTAEEVVVDYAKSRLTSYKNLPVTVFQIGEKFRNEIRSRGVLLRGKAFDMMDAYSFGKNQSDLDEEYERIKQAYFEIFDRMGMKLYAVGADNGDIGGSKSEEFVYISEIGEDNILFDEKSSNAFNSELLERIDALEYLKENYNIDNIDNLITRKAVELGHIFQLGDKYSKSMGAGYINEEGKQESYYMGCYGIGVSRTVALLYEKSIVRNDKGEFSGIALPINLSPYTLYIIPKVDDEEKLKKAEEVYLKLKERGIMVLFDDRKDLSIGAKIKDSKMVGTPYMVVLGKTLEEGFVELENNASANKLSITIDDLIEAFTALKLKGNQNKTIEDILGR